MGFSTADVIIILTILVSMGIGIYRGFIRELLTIITWVVAAFIAYMYGKTLGATLVFIDNQILKDSLGIGLVFIGIIAIGYTMKLIAIKAGKLAGVATIDRVVGALFGVLRGCVLVVLVLLLASKNMHEQDWYKKSMLLPSFAKAADVTAKATPESWQKDIKREVDDLLQAKQCEAPVEQAQPTTDAPATTNNNDATSAATTNSKPEDAPAQTVNEPANVGADKQKKN